jgi:hypothetical protein
VPEKKSEKIERWFAPTDEIIRESRDRVREVVRITTGHNHPFTKSELETIMRSAKTASGRQERN